MYEKAIEEVCPPKIFTEIQDIFNSTPFQNVLYRNSNNNNQQETASDDNQECLKIDVKQPILAAELDEYVTCEKYHSLNKSKPSYKSIVRSTSTIFCDLDDIAKRHSFHCISDAYQTSNANILKAMKLPNCTGFQGKSNAIVQECHTPQPPKMLLKNIIECKPKKQKQKYPHNDVLSSEIFLRDKEFGKRLRYNLYYNIDAKHRQKFWSYAKYQTEYTKPVMEKKHKKKDKGKRADDPCPCQLFSYVCPCNNDKSLMDLKNSKYSGLNNKETSATVITENPRKKALRTDVTKENKSTAITHAELETIVAQQVAQQSVHKDNAPDSETFSNQSNKMSKSKKLHKFICPKCKENIEAVSLTEDDASMREDSQSASKELASTAAYNCSTSSRNNSNKNKPDDREICLHEPRCELIPVCQILPNEDGYEYQKNAKKKPSNKSVPRVIRITKACRHHPPCTVVPSCQRANVLRNNCEFIPPCLHRPRCVNLPLCVPLPKNINYDELMGKYASDDEEPPECTHIPKCKLIALCHDSLTKNTEQHYNTCSHVINTADTGKCHNCTYIINSKTTFSPTRWPDKLSSYNSPCRSCKSNKSCQFNCPKSDSFDNKDSSDTNGIIYIRDVGCQFHNTQYSPIESLAPYASSASFDYADRYYTNTHTLRCEDKCINSTMEQDPLSTDSVMSVEIDSNCPSHGNGGYSKNQHSNGIIPKQAYVTAYADIALAPSTVLHKLGIKADPIRKNVTTHPVKPRRSFFKGKCRLFSVKKSKMSNHFMSDSMKVTAN